MKLIKKIVEREYRYPYMLVQIISAYYLDGTFLAKKIKTIRCIPKENYHDFFL